jgi:hypothetical protein
MSSRATWGLILIAAVIVAAVLLFGGTELYHRDSSGGAGASASLTPAERAAQQKTALGMLDAQWPEIQKSVPFRPTFHNQEAQKADFWRPAGAAQFISDRMLLVEFEDDNNVHVAIVERADGELYLNGILKNFRPLTPEEWRQVVADYGDPSVPAATYVHELVRGGEIVWFDAWTLVPENVFLKDYWNAGG